MLREIGIEPVRPLPHSNETAERSTDHLDYYPPEVHHRAVWIFGPFMSKWGYELPRDWGVSSVPLTSRLSFRALGVL